MNICQSGHSEIVYDGRECPLCEEIQTRVDMEMELKSEIKSLESDLEKSENYIIDLDEEIANLKAGQ
jgi:hypothetical protein